MTTATATEPDLAAFRDHLDDAAALLDEALEEVAALIRAGTWGEEELSRFLIRFQDRPALHEHLQTFVERVRAEID